jgi:CheY-like chemotaxis protein
MLLVSGDPRVTAQVTAALVGRGDLALTEVARPERALQQVDDAGPFDIVVADNDTHPTGGYHLARELGARRQAGRTVPPVVLLIARQQDDWLADWAQADAWVLKPPDPFDLAEVVDTLVAGRRVPELPGVGGDPKPSLLDPPADDAAALPGEAAAGGAAQDSRDR